MVQMGGFGRLVRFGTDVAEDFLNLFTGGAEVTKANKYLHGGRQPVLDELFVENLEVVGKLPAELNGEFVRNGPNPKLPPRHGYHAFDGDGMLHGVRIKDGKATYINRFVRTARLAQEEAHGRPIFIKMGDVVGFIGLLKLLLWKLRVLLGAVDVTDGYGTANTALVYHDGQLLALQETDHPYAIKVLMDGQLETLGVQHYDGRLKHPFSAHPKVDAKTGEMLIFGYSVEQKPHCHFSVVDEKGKLVRTVAINTPDPVMMHDFAITERYAVFIDVPLIFRPKEVMKGHVPFVFDDKRSSRFGVLPRDAESEAECKWFELPSCMIFHTVNAWEEGDVVKMYACRMDNLVLGGTEAQKTIPSSPLLTEFSFNMKTGAANMKLLSNVAVDFPRCRETLIGYQNQYAYCAVFSNFEANDPIASGLMKYDLSKAGAGLVEAGRIDYAVGCSGGEPVFVPRDEQAAGENSEDDGWLLTFVQDFTSDKSYLCVYDAKTMSSEPVAKVVIPRQVPSGFHAIFVSEAQLQAQKYNR
eukprot:jgi/Chlat1/6907/Chrsp52S06635